MKNIKILILSLALVLGMSSCESWLKDVDQFDKQLEKDVYATPDGIRSVLVGLYMKMGDQALYGDQLTLGTVDVLAQMYDLSTATSDNNPSRANIRDYNWTASTSETIREDIWTAGYAFIRNVNDLIVHLEDESILGVIDATDRDLMLGEAYALRAYMHFDLLRLYGPVLSVNPTGLSIPYYKSITSFKQPRLEANVALGFVLDDVETALNLLADDPVRTDGPKIGADVNSENEIGFWEFRNQRLNYFAVKTLKARVLMYSGDKTAAATVAQEVLDAPNFLYEYFPWAARPNVTTDFSTDRIMYTDVLFGFFSRGIYETYDRALDGADISLPYNVLTIGQALVERLFPNITGSNGDSDMRAKNLTKYTSGNYYVRKFFRPTTENRTWRIQPLIRKSELFYIIAEGNSDAEKLKDVVRARNATVTISDTYNQDNLNDEFIREMFQEGQIFFHFKRLNATTIGMGYTTMTPGRYQMPYPTKEDDY